MGKLLQTDSATLSSRTLGRSVFFKQVSSAIPTISGNLNVHVDDFQNSPKNL
ncbi:hypothetical protein KDX27_41925 [Burkholderia cenocepacia]|uniref:hypothetical protein n=1 Tax=Burkholderia cenocepacia TaxID=95486 RepID=UPI00187D529D|nr:hypothetical protein [Burkholderia cenocepacia]MBJ9698069.1 hypothetical protein [Burkholderia cenocepacia]MBN3530991.1 hypothetical protein [Burkholderia cenocepacia]MBO1859387.1 hypothetical protein [Burkholderia cenocepacia]MBR8030350.1 hypothetical protein [Burkholderia cenocepacia]MBR8174227.1 hypothetical protein [Burkholderia cenocepacia]